MSSKNLPNNFKPVLIKTNTSFLVITCSLEALLRNSSKQAQSRQGEVTPKKLSFFSSNSPRRS